MTYVAEYGKKELLSDIVSGRCNESDLQEYLNESNISGFLKGADLRGVDFRGMSLRGYDLFRANLEGANLEGTNLRMSDLRDTNLKEANLEGACFYSNWKKH